MSQPPPFPNDTIVDRYGFQPHSVEYLGSAGGFSGANFWRFQASEHGLLCLRRWSAKVPAERVATVHSIIGHAAGNGAQFLAVPLPDRHGATHFELQSHVYEVACWLSGNADFHTEPNPERLKNAMIALAQFHGSVASHPKFRPSVQVADGILARRQRLFELRQRRFDQIRAATLSNQHHELADLACAVVERVQPKLAALLDEFESLVLVPVRTQLCLRDVRHDHVLFDGNSVSGIVDYDALRIDSVALDIARLVQSLVGNDAQRWHAAVDAYSNVSSLRENERRMLEPLRNANPVLSALTWLEWLFMDKRTFEDMQNVRQRIAWLANLI